MQFDELKTYFKHFDIHVEREKDETMITFSDSQGFMLISELGMTINESTIDTDPYFIPTEIIKKSVFMFKDVRHDMVRINVRKPDCFNSMDFVINYDKGCKKNNIPENTQRKKVLGLLMGRIFNFIHSEQRFFEERYKKRITNF